ncbi:DUF2244 domain-containing protein [uncultured Marinobacter sp.]|uniref:DUF2244 domain-containing protein n=1 Tax=uncultured Marinobacter sp. TaxID=187379 RepID=UPI0030D95770
MITRLPSEEGIRLLLTPNRSISWRGIVLVWLGLVAVSMLVVVLMVFAGAWLVLPFAGIELTALAVGLYVAARKCWRQEVLDIGVETLTLEKGRYHRRESQLALPRRYTRVQLEPAPQEWAPPRLFLSHRDTRVALGAFLNPADIEELVGLLARNGFRLEYPPPTFEGFWW